MDEAKVPSYTMTLKQWIGRTNEIGLVSRQGRNGGTLAHPDIACDFHMWLYPEFRLSLVHRFMDNENNYYLDEQWIKEAGE